MAGKYHYYSFSRKELKFTKEQNAQCVTNKILVIIKDAAFYW